ncbi:MULTISPECIES: fimbrial protein [Buttiauxella]|uniref:fimbrial protein n=1 Tax=Buttiauxella TaxID=82976 RepID=UPI001065E300|nr:fimbrial protein [Buttiauxella sp. BIGb0552]TDX20039.1 minor fimbrial subunit [Buttiauxella sp. BIGb0552]
MPRYRYLLILSLLLVWQANAEDISITGRVVDKPCTIDVDTESKLVNLGTVMFTRLRNAGSGSNWVDFELLLEDCSRSTVSVTASFSGEANIDDITAFKNQGSAKNVALQISNTDHSVIYGDGSQKIVTITTDTHKAIFPLSARIISPLGNGSGGSFRSVVNVDFTYQ